MQVIGTDLGAQLREAYRLAGSPPQLSVAPDLLPVCNAITLDDSPWHSKRGFSGWRGTLAGAGNNAYFSLGLDDDAPETARLVLRSVTVAANASGDFTIGLAAFDASGGGWDVPDWEQRSASGTIRAPIRADLGGTALGGAAEVMAGCRVQAGFVTQELLGPWILGPGVFLKGRFSGVNVETYFSIYGDLYGL